MGRGHQEARKGEGVRSTRRQRRKVPLGSLGWFWNFAQYRPQPFPVPAETGLSSWSGLWREIDGGGGQGALSPQCTSPQTRMGCAHTLRRSEARRRYLYKSSRTHEKDLTYVALELASLRSTGRVGEGVAARGAGAGLELSSSAEIEPPGSQSGRQTSPSSKEGWPFGAFPSFSEPTRARSTCLAPSTNSMPELPRDPLTDPPWLRFGRVSGDPSSQPRWHIPLVNKGPTQDVRGSRLETWCSRSVPPQGTQARSPRGLHQPAGQDHCCRRLCGDKGFLPACGAAAPHRP